MNMWSIDDAETRESDTVSLRWYEGPPQPAAAELLTRTRATDTEMSFAGPTQLSPDREPARWVTAEVRTMLHRWGTPRPALPRLAAVLILRPETSRCIVDLVVDPSLRSCGVATSVLEHLEASFDTVPIVANNEGNMVGCSFGSHPAAQRLARRFGIEPIALRDRLLLPSRAAFDNSRLTSRPATATIDVTVTDPTPDPTRSEWNDFDDPGTTRQHYQVRAPDGTVLGRFRLGTSRRDDGVVAELDEMEIVHHRSKDSFGSTASVVRGAVETAWQYGCVAIEAAVDVTHTELIDALRAAAFQHDRTDTLFARLGWLSTK